MSHHVGMLMFDNGIEVREIINHARTLEHLRNADVACSRITFHDTECDVLSLDQCSYDPVTFTTPDDVNRPAPWYDGVEGSPSSNGYGFWIEEWTGLDGSHMRRGASASYPRGSIFGQLGQPHRVWKMNVSLYGADAVALEDLFRWLEESLIACCQPGVTAWIRTTCPDGYDNDYGLVHVLDAQLLEGVEWIEPAIPELGCFSRRVSFTIGVGDPCLYRPPVECLDDESFTFPASTILLHDGSNYAVANPESLPVRWDGGDLEIIWAGYLNDWTPAAASTLVSHTHPTNPNDFGFVLTVTATGALRIRYSQNGTTFGIDYTTTALLSAVAPAAGVIMWVSVRRDAASGVIQVRYSYDGEDWTLLEATTSTAGALNAPTYEIQIGNSVLGSGGAAGATARVELWEGFKEAGGTAFAIMDPNERIGSAVSWTSANNDLGWTTAFGATTFGSYAGLLSPCSIGLAGIFGCDEDPDAFADYRLCCEVAGERIGVTAPVVVLRNDGTESFSPPMRVVGITDNGSGCLVANNEIFGEVRISGIPPQSELMIDCARRRVLWRPVGYLTPWEPGYAYIDSSISHVPDYPAVGCNDAIIFIEPTTITPSLLDLRASVWMVGRYGCC
jgi:hypothetical protein